MSIKYRLASFLLFVFSSVAAQVDAGSDISICAGETVSLSGSGAGAGGSYTWSNGIVDGQSFTPSVTTTVTVSGYDSSNTLVGTDDVTITVNPLPQAPTTDQNYSTSYCLNSNSTELSAIALNGHQLNWYDSSNNLLSTVTSRIPPTNTVGVTTYSVTQTDQVTGCESSQSLSVSITVNELPTLTIQEGSAQVICSGESATLTAVGAGTSGTYTWDNGVVNGVSFNPSASSSYTVTGVDNNGCASVITASINLNSPPVINAGADVSICAGESVTLTGSGAGTGGSYSWTGGVSDGVAFSPSSTGTYTVTGTDGNGCVGTDEVTVTVNAIPSAPTADPSNVTQYCLGATSSSMSAVSISGYTLKWYDVNDNLLVTGSTGPVPTTTSAGSTTYKVTQTNGVSQCESAALLITVVVDALPTVSVVGGSSQSLCDGSSVSLSGSGAVSYSWSGVDASNNAISNGTSFVPPASTTTTYTVTGTDGNGCSNSTSVDVTSTGSPVINAGADVSICAGESVTLTGSGAGTGGSYSWTGGVSDGVAFSPSSTGTYTVTGTDGNGCVGTDEVTVTVNAIPSAPTADPSNVTQYCLGATSSSMSAVSISGYTLKWYDVNDNLLVTGSTGPVPTTTSAGSTTYKVTQTNGVSQCESAALLITVVVDALPTVSVVQGSTKIVCDNLSVFLQGTGASSYSWSGLDKQGNTVVNRTSFTPPLSTTTVYTVTGTDGNGCTNTSSIQVSSVPGPSITASASPSVICEGEAATLSASGLDAALPNNSYVWSTGPGKQINVSPLTTTTYTVTGTDANGCTGSAQATLSVTPSPDAPSLSPSNVTEYCKGDLNPSALEVVVDNNNIVNWYNSNMQFLYSGASGPVPSTNTAGVQSYYATQTNPSSGCESLPLKVDINIYELPTISATNRSVCLGDTLILTASGAGIGGTYTWYNGGTAISTPNITPTASTQYTVKGENSSGCIGEKTIDVIVNQTPIAPNVVSPIKYCKDAAAQPLSAITTGNSTLKWYELDGVTPKPLNTPTTPGTTNIGSTKYYVSQVNSSGCEGPLAEIEVIIEELPIAPVVSTPVITYCLNETPTALVAAAKDGNHTLRWYDALGNLIGNGVSPIPSTSIAGVKSYFVSQVNNQTGCEGARSSIEVTVHSVPAVPVAPSVEYCLNDNSTILTATALSGHTLKWYDTDGQTYLPSGAPTPLTSNAGLSTYYVSQVNSDGCEGVKESVDVLVHDLPVISASASANPICEGEEVILSASGAGNNGTYTWNNSVMNGIAFIPTSTATYSITGIDENGCSNTSTIQVVVNPEPATFQIEPNNFNTKTAGNYLSSICDLDSIQFSSDITASAGTLTWYRIDDNNDTTLFGLGLALNKVNLAGRYFAVFENSLGCSKLSDNYIDIEVDELSSPTFFKSSTYYTSTNNTYTNCQASAELTLNTAFESGVTYTVLYRNSITNQWDSIGAITSANPNITPTQSGRYKILARKQGCSHKYSTEIIVALTELPKPQLAQQTAQGALCNINDLELLISNESSYSIYPNAVFTVTSSSPDSSTIGSSNLFSKLSNGNYDSWSPDVVNGHYENATQTNRFIDYYVQASSGGCVSTFDTIRVEQYYSPVETPVILADGVESSTITVCNSDPIVDLQPDNLSPFVRYEWYDADDYDANYPNVTPEAQSFDSTSYSINLTALNSKRLYLVGYNQSGCMSSNFGEIFISKSVPVPPTIRYSNTSDIVQYVCSSLPGIAEYDIEIESPQTSYRYELYRVSNATPGPAVSTLNYPLQGNSFDPMSQSGTYRAFSIDTNGCESDFGNSLEIEAVTVIKPQLSYPSGVNLPVTACENEDVQIEINNWSDFSNLSTLNDYSFSWYRVDNGISTFLGTSTSQQKQVNVGEDLGSINSFEAKFYVVAEHVSMGACMMASDTLAVTVMNTPSAPVVTTYLADTICLGQDIDLVATSGDAFIPQPTFLWYSVNLDGTLNASIGTGDTLTRAPLSGGVYKYAVVASNSGCEGPASTRDIYVQELTPPILEPITSWQGGTFMVCQDSTIDLRVSTPLIEGAKYELYKKDAINGQFFAYPSQTSILSFVYDSNIQNSNSFNNIPEGEYRAKVTKGDCEIFGELSMIIDEVVLDKPDITFGLNESSTLCTDSSTILVLDDGQTIGATYQWYSYDASITQNQAISPSGEYSLNTPNQNDLTITPGYSGSGTTITDYYLLGSYSASLGKTCLVHSDTLRVTAFDRPEGVEYAGVALVPPVIEVCIGATAVLPASAPSTATYDWSWYKTTNSLAPTESDKIPNASSDNITVSESGYYYAAVTDVNGCMSNRTFIMEYDFKGPIKPQFEAVNDPDNGVYQICADSTGTFEVTNPVLGAIYTLYKLDAAGNYVRLSNTSFTHSSANPPRFTGLGEGVFKVEADENLCNPVLSDNSIEIERVNIADFGIQLVQNFNQEVCQNELTKLEITRPLKKVANGFNVNEAIRWYDENGNYIDNTEILIVPTSSATTPSGIEYTAEISAMVNGDYKCPEVSYNDFKIIVNPTPAAPVLDAVYTVCEGESVVFDAKDDLGNSLNGNSGYRWFYQESLVGSVDTINSEISSILTINNVVLSDSGYYSVDYISPKGCESEASFVAKLVVDSVQTPGFRPDNAPAGWPNSNPPNWPSAIGAEWLICPGDTGLFLVTNLDPYDIGMQYNLQITASNGVWQDVPGKSFLYPNSSGSSVPQDYAFGIYTSGYYRVRASRPGQSCKNKYSEPIYVQVDTEPQPVLGATSLSICVSPPSGTPVNDSTKVFVTNLPDPTVRPGASYWWYRADISGVNGGDQLVSITNGELIINRGGTYYAVLKYGINSCEIVSTSITIDENIAPNNPILEGASPYNICASTTGGLATKEVKIYQPQAYNYFWYDALNLSNYKSIGSMVQYPQGNYLVVSENDGCYSDTTYFDILQQDITRPEVSPQNGTICPQDSLLLQITNPQAGIIYVWYRDGWSTPLDTGWDYYASIQGNYYTIGYQGGSTDATGTVSLTCQSAASAFVPLTVNPFPSTPVHTDLYMCDNDFVTPLSSYLNVPNGLTPYWYISAENEIPLGFGNNVFLDQVAVLGVRTSLWVAYTNDQTGCFSERTEMDLFVLESPEISPIVNDTVVCSGAAFNLQNMVQNWTGTNYKLKIFDEHGNAISNWNNEIITQDKDTTFIYTFVFGSNTTMNGLRCYSGNTQATLTVKATPATPSAGSIAFSYCEGDDAGDMLYRLAPYITDSITANLYWYTSPNIGPNTSLNAAPVISTDLAGSGPSVTSYWLTRKNWVCESQPTQFDIGINTKPSNSIFKDDSIVLCNQPNYEIATQTVYSPVVLSWYGNRNYGSGDTSVTTFALDGLAPKEEWYFATKVDGLTGCESNLDSIKVRISVNTETPKALFSGMDTVICSSERPFSLSDLFEYDETNFDLVWYSDTSGSNPTLISPYYIPFLSQDSAGLYVGLVDKENCAGPITPYMIRKSITPDAPITRDTAYCFGGDVAPIEDLVDRLPSHIYTYYDSPFFGQGTGTYVRDSWENDFVVYASATNSYGCESDRSIIGIDIFKDTGVYITAAPVVIPDGGLTTLKATGADTYVFYGPGDWDDGAIGSDSTSPAELTLQPATTGAKWYKVRGTRDSTGCTGIDSVQVHVNSFDPGTIGFDVEICAGQRPTEVRGITYPSGGSGTYEFEWWIGSPAGDTILKVNSPSLTFPLGLLPQQYYADTLRVIRRAIDSEALALSDTVTISVVNVPPINVVELNDDYNIPTGHLTSFTSFLNHNVDYTIANKWLIDGQDAGLYNDTLLNIYLDSGRHEIAGRIYYVDSLGRMRCHRESKVVVNVSDLMPGVLNPEQTVCFDEKPQDLFVVDSANGGSGDYFYAWEIYDVTDSIWKAYLDTSGVQVSDPVLAFDPTVGFKRSQRFRRLVIDHTVTKYTTTSHITVLPQPQAPVVDTPMVCFGKYVGTLGATPTSGYEIEWYNNNNTSSILNNAPVMDSLYAGDQIYYVAQRDTIFGCVSDLKKVVFRMEGLPLPPTVVPVSVCENDTSRFELEADTTITNSSLLWFGADTITGLSGTPILSGASLDSNDMFFVAQMDTITGCVSEKIELPIDLRYLPEGRIVSGAENFTVCKNDYITLSLQPYVGYTSVHWYSISSSGDTVAIDTAATISANPMKSTLYWAQAVTDLGCYTDYYQNVTVQELPLIPSLKDYEYCQDEDATTIAADSLYTGNSLLYFNTLSQIDTVKYLPIPPTDSVGLFKFYASQYDSITGCVSPVDTSNVRVFGRPRPPLARTQYFCLGTPDTLVVDKGYGSRNSAYKLEWFDMKNNGLISTPVISSSDTGKIYFKVRNEDIVGTCFSDLTTIEAVVYQNSIEAVYAQDSTTCFNDSDAVITVDVDGPFITNWFYVNQNGWESSAFADGISTNVPSGQYFIYTRDTAGCQVHHDTAIDYVVVHEPDLLTLDSVYIASKIQCYDSTDAVIKLWASGGNSISYSIDSLSFSKTKLFDSVGPGEYWPTLSDSKGCDWGNRSRYDSLELIEPDPIYVNFVKENLLCANDFNGSIEALIQGGNWDSTEFNFGWDYTWVFDSTTAQYGQKGYHLNEHVNVIDSLWAGDYVLTATDYKGCFVVDTVRLIQPDSVIVDSIFSKNVTCFDSSNAIIEVYAQGGTSLFYTVNEPTMPFTKQSSYNTLSQGDTLLVTVQDTNLCPVSYKDVRKVIFDSLEVFRVADVLVSEPLCFNDSTGRIEVVVEGGSFPLFNIDSTSVIYSDSLVFTSVPADTVYITVTDTNSCVPQYAINREVIISEPERLRVNARTESGVICFEDTTGIISATIAGGTQPYDILWSNGTVALYDSAVAGGLYYFEVYDDNGCYAFDSTTVGSFDRDCDGIPDSVETFSDCDWDGIPNAYDLDSDNDGISDALEYDYDRDGIVGDDCDGDGVPNYCDPDLCEFYIPSVITPNYDGKNDALEIPGLDSFENYKFSVFNIYGNKVFESENSGSGFGGTNQDPVVWFSNDGELPSGTYFYVLEIRPNKWRQSGYIYIAR